MRHRMVQRGRNLLLGAGLAAVSVTAAAQPTLSVQPPADSPGLSRSLDLFVYPREGQPANQQILDEGQCFGWARTQTGIDPLAAPETRGQTAGGAPQTSGADRSGTQSAMAGAAGGAAAGTAIGAIAGDTSKGAAIGATTGLRQRARQNRKAALESEKKAQADAAMRAQAAGQQQRETFGRAFGACMEARGYTVK